MIEEGFEVDLGLELGLDGANKPFETAKTVEFFAIADFCRIERGAKKV